MALPTDVVGEEIPVSIGSVETRAEVVEFNHERNMVSYKDNMVYVRARCDGSARQGGVTQMHFWITEQDWRRLNEEVV